MVLLAALLFSTGGAAIKATELDSWLVASGRAGIAVAILLLLVRESRRRWNLATLVVGAAYAATMILFVHANKLTTAANTIFLQATAPLWVLLLAPWLLAEPVRRRDLYFLAAFGLGLGLFFVDVEAPVRTAADPFLGNLLAVLAGLTYGLTLLGLRKVERDTSTSGPSGLSVVVCGNALACLLALPWGLPVGSVRGVDLLVVGYLGIFQVAVAYILLTAALRHLGALEVSILLLLEPTLSPLWAWLLHGERPGGWALAGGVVILGATVLRAWLEAARASRLS